MIVQHYTLWQPEEYTCPTAGDFIPHLTAYLHSGTERRTTLLIIPGGAYRMVAVVEAEPVAERFYRMGFNTCLLTYTTALFSEAVMGDLPLKDAARAVRVLRKHADTWHVDPERIIGCGFSAGGHLTASLAERWDDPVLEETGAFGPFSCRLNGLMLCYPVITSGESTHADTMAVLLGKNPTPERHLQVSLEKHVDSRMPPVFLWSTLTDETVPVENSLLFEAACRTAGVSCETHLFREGPHGLGLADGKQASDAFGQNTTMTQFFAWMQYHIDHRLPLPGQSEPLPWAPGTPYEQVFQAGDYQSYPCRDAVALWPELAERWIHSIFPENKKADTPPKGEESV